MNSHLVPTETIEKKIYVIRERKVMLDRDLAELYNVATRELNKAVKRNLDRFPADFMLQLTHEEFKKLSKMPTIAREAAENGIEI